MSQQRELKGRIAVVTGSNTGIGKEIARGLAERGATVVIASRSEERGRAARDEIAQATGNDGVIVEQVDVASAASIARFAERLSKTFPKIDVLVNNAGVWATDKRMSEEGHELTWGTNVLGYYRMTNALLENLKAAGTPERKARIVSVASEMAGDLDLGDPEFSRRKYNGVTAYKQSKQANRMWTWALARRIERAHVSATVMHPGWVATELAREGVGGALLSAASKIFARTPKKGADTAVWLATSPEVEGLSGRFYVDRTERKCRFRGEANEEALWELLAAA